MIIELDLDFNLILVPISSSVCKCHLTSCLSSNTIKLYSQLLPFSSLHIQINYKISWHYFPLSSELNTLLQTCNFIALYNLMSHLFQIPLSGLRASLLHLFFRVWRIFLKLRAHHVHLFACPSFMVARLRQNFVE